MAHTCILRGDNDIEIYIHQFSPNNADCTSPFFSENKILNNCYIFTP